MKNILTALTISGIVISPIANADNSSTISKISNTAHDAAIVTKIKSKYLASSSINPTNVSVSSNSGHVKLDGTVKNNQSYTDAVTLASETNCVKCVNVKKLKRTESEKPLRDFRTSTQIRAELVKDQFLNKDHINHGNVKISTLNDHVYMSGHVNNTEEKNKLIKTASKYTDQSKVHASGIHVNNKQKMEVLYV